MTEEQIKQNAEEYAKDEKQYYLEIGCYDLICESFIAGAHSRDEEIKALEKNYREEFDVLKEELESLRKGFYERGDKLKELMLANNKLRNPWISVEERLPEEHSKVLIMFCNGTVTYNNYIGVGDINYMKAHSKIITHWMPIPKIDI